MRLQYFTYFLNPVSQGSLFPSAQRDKNEILMDILSGNLTYDSRNSHLEYISCRAEGKFIHAKLGKKSEIKRTTPAEHDFNVEIESNYPYCNVFFNCNDDPQTGQKIAFQLNRAVFFSPVKQLRIFAEEINKTLEEKGYVISIHPVSEKNDFWKYIEEHKGKIEKLTFSYAVPNLFDLTEDTLNAALKETGKKYSTTNAEITLENKSGLLNVSKQDRLITESVQYTTRGGGDYKIKIKGKKTLYSSDTNVKTEEIEIEAEIPPNSPEFKGILDKIFE